MKAFALVGALAGACVAFACATAGRPALDPAKAAQDAHAASVAACRAYHAAVALGAPANAQADAACAVAQGVCGDAGAPGE